MLWGLVRDLVPLDLWLLKVVDFKNRLILVPLSWLDHG